MQLPIASKTNALQSFLILPWPYYAKTKKTQAFIALEAFITKL